MKSFAVTHIVIAAALMCAAIPTAFVACTPAQLAAVNTGFSASQAACSGLAMAAASIPPGVLPAQVAVDLKLACAGVALADVAEQDVESFIAAWQAGQPDAGMAATVYRAPTLRRPQ